MPTSLFGLCFFVQILCDSVVHGLEESPDHLIEECIAIAGYIFKLMKHLSEITIPFWSDHKEALAGGVNFSNGW